MTPSAQLANRFREVILNGRWVANTNFKAQLSGVSWEQATRKVGSLNTIAALTFHIHYYIAGILKVFEGGALDIRDKYSFDMPPIQSQQDWDKLRDSLWRDAERFADLVEQMPEARLQAVFVDEKYGAYQRNIDGMIEHSYYHLGQVSLIRKLLESQGVAER
ncbi:MAG: DinB family protein [Phaeodactylibacter sp.]|nr:DinB family protein [Phaeodactylibacter sp.]MCB9299141.1 DinB family protein [Lewinellaceae bacterium]